MPYLFIVTVLALTSKMRYGPDIHSQSLLDALFAKTSAEGPELRRFIDKNVVTNLK